MRVKQMTTMELGIHDVFTGIADDNDIAAFWRVSFSDERKADDNGRAGDNDVLTGKATQLRFDEFYFPTNGKQMTTVELGIHEIPI